MRERFTVSEAPHRLQAPLSARIAAMRSRFQDVSRCEAPFTHDDMDALDENLKDFVGEVLQLESERRDKDASALIAFDLVCQTGDELTVLRSLLTGMIHSPGEDIAVDDQVRCAFARARALLEKGEATFLGKVKP